MHTARTTPTVLDTDTLCHLCGPPIATGYADRLLRSLGASVQVGPRGARAGQVDRWRESGLADITGLPGTPLPQCPVPIGEFADGALDALEALAGTTVGGRYRGAELLTLRAAMTQGQRRGDISVGGSCRFLSAADGVIAVNLARDSDWELVNAWLTDTVAPEWPAIAEKVRQLDVRQLVDQGRLLGLAIAEADPPLPGQQNWYEIVERGPRRPPTRPPRVVDLSSLWAGPLCGWALGRLGAQVVKVESRQRPDGARFGDAAFFDFLNSTKDSLTLDLHTARGVAQLRELIRNADIVIEASRPRALAQMGIDAQELVATTPGLTWISITGHGRADPAASWIAYGDDAGVAGGLSAAIHRATGQWLFCGDAIADPLTGLHAALAGYASWRSGGGHLLCLSLVGTVQHCVLAARDRTHP